MSSPTHPPERRWANKFRDALRGLVIGVRGQSSFVVHLMAAAAVIALAAALQLSRWKWSVLTICIGVVVAAELFNAALETLARAITSQRDEQIRDALDIAAGAVLTTAIAAAVVGVIVLGPDLWRWAMVARGG